MKKSIIVFFLVSVILLMYGCVPEEEVTKNPAENHTCVDCRKQATVYAGDIWQNYETVELYFCDECFENRHATLF